MTLRFFGGRGPASSAPGTTPPVLSNTAPNIGPFSRPWTIVDVSSLEPRDVRGLNGAATGASGSQATIAGANSVIPIVYGRRRVGAKIAAVTIDEADLLILAVWSLGEIDAVEAVTINDTLTVPLYTGGGAIPFGTFGRVDYLGTTTQAPDPSFASAVARAGGGTYLDDLRGADWSTAYSVIRIPVSAGVAGFPRITATIRGKRVALVAGAAVALDGSNDYAYAPDSTTTRVDEDFVLDVRASLVDWTPAAEQVVASKWNQGAAKRTWRLSVTATGALSLLVSTDGTAITTYTSTAVNTFANGSTNWVRAAFRKNNGASASDVKFYTSPDGLTWTQLGATVTGAVIASLYQSDAQTRIGADYGSFFLAGTVYFASLTTTTKIAWEFRPFGIVTGGTTWTARTGETWTLSGGTTTASGGYGFTQTPADVLADFVRSTAYGLGRDVEYRHLAALQAFNAGTVGAGADAEQRHRIDLALDSSQSTQTWLNVLRDYAHCWAVPEGDEYVFVRDWDDPAVATFTAANIVAGSLKVTKRGAQNQATIVEVTYTDTTTTPWRDQTVTQYFPGVLSGAVSRRLSRIAKPGICRYTEANRYAIEVLNESTLGDLTIVFRAFDDAAAVRVGNIVNVTHPIGFAAKPFRVTKVDAVAAGRWQITATEFDPALYSSVVVQGPTIPDTSIPSPSAPPSVVSVSAIEEKYQTKNNLWASRVRVTWSLPTSFPNQFVKAYRVEAFEGALTGPRAFVAEVGTTEFITPPLKELQQYVVSVRVISTSGAEGAIATDEVTPLGKYLAPTDVTQLSGFEAGGIVFLSWNPSTDIAEDVVRYEVRRGTTSDTWGATPPGTLVDRVDGLTARVEGLTPGNYRFFVKAIDSVGTYSANAASVDVTVTTDQSAFLVIDNISQNPLLWGMSEWSTRSATHWTTDWADGFEYGTTTTDNASGTFNDAAPGSGEYFASPHSGGTYFTGASYVDVPDVAAHRLATALTLELWFFPTELNLASANVIARKDTETGTRYLWGLFVDTDGKPAAQYYNGTVYTAKSASVIPNRKWTHLAMTISGTALTFYVNGVADGTATIGGTQGVPTGRISFGCAPPSTAGARGFYTMGNIKRVRLWNVARTAAEIAKSSSYGGVPPGLTGCVGNWRMDDKDDGEVTTTVADTTATSNGTHSGMGWSSRSAIVSETFDVGGVVTGIFTNASTVSHLTGSSTPYVDTSTDATNWTRVDALTQRAVARYFRVGFNSDVRGSMTIEKGQLRGTVSISPKTELGTIAVADSGRSTVTLAGGYSTVSSIQLTPINTTLARFAVADNVRKSNDRGFRKGRTLAFPGIATSNANVGNQALYEFGNGTTDSAFTIEFWIYIAADPSPGYYEVMGKGSSSAGAYLLRIGTYRDLEFIMWDRSASASRVLYGQKLPVRTWQHYAITFDPTLSAPNYFFEKFRVYINGVAQPVGGFQTGTYVAMETSTEPLRFGSDSVQGGSMLGQLDEIRFWNVARSASQIAANFQDYVAANSTGLIGYWKCDESSGTTANDSTSNAKHATLSGTTSFEVYDGFDVYLFNYLNARVAGDVAFDFKGA